MPEKFTIGLIVLNRFGVLNRIAGLYAKRGYNIDSLAVGETQDPNYSRMTIVSSGSEYMKDQVVRQLAKLQDVKSVCELEKQASVGVEHMLIKLCANNGDKVLISALINSFGGKVMDFSSDFITAEITGDSEKIEEFINSTRKFGILEVCRSGLICLSQGTQNMLGIN